MPRRDSPASACPTVMRSWRHVAIGVLAALLSALGAPRSAAADLTGVWLIDAATFDAAVESGLDVAAWPVLVVRDGAFRLYRLNVSCVPLDAAGESINDVDAADAVCTRAALANAGDGLAGNARLLAEGTLEVAAADRVRFVSRTVAAVPQSWRREIARAADGERPPELSAADWRRLRPALATFYTTFHIGDGAWMTARADDRALVLARANGEELRYARSSGTALSATMGVLDTFELSGIKYFRCLYQVVQTTRQGGPDRAELARLVELGALAAARYRRGHASALLEAGERAQFDRIWSAQDETWFRATTAAVRAHPLARSTTAGGVFGCPDRDRLL